MGKFKPQKAVLRETGHIAIGVFIMVAVMLAVYAVIGKFSSKVLMGGVYTGILTVLNFFIMGLTVQSVAETAAEKNSSTLYPSYDQSNSATLPNQPGFIRINTIGGSNWSDPGDAISWRVDVPQAGLYQITFRARQVYNEGLHAYY